LLLLGGTVTAAAQDAPTSAPSPAAQPGTVVTVPATDVFPGAAVAPAPHHFTVWETVSESVCGQGSPDRPFTPLTCGTLFSEGWCEPWISPPAGSGGAVRQGWINDFQGFFSRDVFGVYTYNNHRGGAYEQVGNVSVESPLSRRLLLGVYSDVVDSVHGADGGPSATSYGDTLIIPKVMLHETEDVSILGALSVRVPTGERSTGNDRTVLSPFVAGWFDLGRGFALRTGVSLDVPVDNVPGPDATLNVGLALGQTLTKHDAAPLGDLTWFVCSNLHQDLGAGDHTVFSLTPGVRTHLGNNWFLIGGVEVPVTGPKPFQEGFTVVLIKGW
jgi:hypothetical protein